jgi:hypothetical protein
MKLVQGTPHPAVTVAPVSGPSTPVPHRAADAFAGPHELRALLGRCFGTTHGNYEYQICPFVNVTQREASSSWTAFYGILGLWGRWVGRAPTGTAALVGAKQRYDDGTECTGIGRRRHAEVRWECSRTGSYSLTDVREPRTCEYELVFTCPEACGPGGGGGGGNATIAAEAAATAAGAAGAAASASAMPSPLVPSAATSMAPTVAQAGASVLPSAAAGRVDVAAAAAARSGAAADAAIVSTVATGGADMQPATAASLSAVGHAHVLPDASPSHGLAASPPAGVCAGLASWRARAAAMRADLAALEADLAAWEGQCVGAPVAADRVSATQVGAVEDATPASAPVLADEAPAAATMRAEPSVAARAGVGRKGGSKR